MGVGERIGTVLRIFVLLAVLVAVALVSAIATIRLTIRGRQETMPNLVGMPLDKAERMLGSRGLALKVEDKLFSTKYDANQIVSQMPPEGTPLKGGQHVQVIVSLGAPRVRVPNLVGGSLRVARIAAFQRGLNVGDVAAVYWPGAEPDQVLVQDPAPSSAEVHSPAVSLLVAIGDPPVAYLCPNFVGQPLEKIRRVLEKAGFKVQPARPIPADSTPRGTILTQTPPAGSKISSDTVFSFQVAQ